MGLAQSFNKAIKKQLRCYAAWLPIVNTFEIGEYGIFEDGVFKSMGNIKTKYPDIELSVKDSGPAEIEFLSDGSRKFKLDAEGKAIDSFAAIGNAGASIKIVFDTEDSSLIKAKLTSRELKNIDEVASALANKKTWRNKFSIVSKTYTGQNCVVICSKESGTEVEIKASADILQQIEAGKVQGGFEFSSNRDSTFKAIGETGILALELFKLNFFDNVDFLKEIIKDVHYNVEVLQGDIKDDF